MYFFSCNWFKEPPPHLARLFFCFLFGSIVAEHVWPVLFFYQGFDCICAREDGHAASLACAQVSL